MSVHKTIDEINEKILAGKAVVLTAEEVTRLAEKKTPDQIAKSVDVVTTGTFGAMYSSGLFINFGHTSPPIRMNKVYLNDVEAYSGLAAVDAFLGATQSSEKDPAYGGAHVIEELLRGNEIQFSGSGSGSDCYPARHAETYISLEDLNECYLFNPRNGYQNYAAAVNSSHKTIYTYMGKLLPHYKNITYSTSGELSPLLNDPALKTIGIGTKIFMGGTTGFVSWQGTQFSNQISVNKKGIPVGPAATLALIGDLKKMNTQFIRACYFKNYGVSLYMGIGIPIPVLNADIARGVSISNRDIETMIIDYSGSQRKTVGKINYAELRSGKIRINGRTSKTSSLSSLSKAREIAEILKAQIQIGDFLLSKPVAPLPQSGCVKPLKLKEKSASRNSAQRSFSESNYIKIDRQNCISCGACVSVCSENALQLSGTKPNTLQFNTARCSGCYQCLDTCPVGIIFKTEPEQNEHIITGQHFNRSITLPEREIYE